MERLRGEDKLAISFFRSTKSRNSNGARKENPSLCCVCAKTVEKLAAESIARTLSDPLLVLESLLIAISKSLDENPILISATMITESSSMNMMFTGPISAKNVVDMIMALPLVRLHHRGKPNFAETAHSLTRGSLMAPVFAYRGVHVRYRRRRAHRKSCAYCDSALTKELGETEENGDRRRKTIP